MKTTDRYGWYIRVCQVMSWVFLFGAICLVAIWIQHMSQKKDPPVTLGLVCIVFVVHIISDILASIFKTRQRSAAKELLRRVEAAERQDEYEQFDDYADETLDEIVHDLKGEEAAAINNAGREAQLDYIIESNFKPDSADEQAS